MIVGYLVFVYAMCLAPMYDTMPKKVLYKSFDDAYGGAQQVATEQANLLDATVETLQLFNPQYYTDRWGSVNLFHIIKASETIGSINVMAVYSEDE
jgi:hypothetical protein